MTADHDALLADLRVLADTVLDRIEALVHQVGTPDDHEDEAAAPPAACTRCPLCALLALVRGENHELLTRLAAQISALIAVIRELLARFLPAPASPPSGDPDGPEPPEPAERGGFVPISVTIRT